MNRIKTVCFSLIILMSACTEKKNNSVTSTDTVKTVATVTTTTQPLGVDIDSLASKMVASKAAYANGEDSDAEERFITKLTAYLTKPASLTTDFSGLDKYNIQVLTSDDGLLKIFYWLSPSSGTMWHVQNILQYQTPDKTIASVSYDTLYEQGKDEGSPTPFFDHIYALKPADKPAYLLLGLGQMSGMEPYAVVRALSWSQGKFSIDNKIFKDGTKLQTELFTSASLLDEENPDQIRQLIKPTFEPTSKTLTYGESKDTKDGIAFTGKQKRLTYKNGIFQ